MALSRVQIINFVIRLIAAVHLSFGVYSMYNALIPRDVMEIDMAFSGKFKYLTFWNVVSIFICVNFVVYVLKWDMTHEKSIISPVAAYSLRILRKCFNTNVSVIGNSF